MSTFTPEERDAIEHAKEIRERQSAYLRRVMRIWLPAYVILALLLFTDWQWVPFALTLSAIVGFFVAAPGLNEWHPAFKAAREARHAWIRRSRPRPRAAYGRQEEVPDAD